MAPAPQQSGLLGLLIVALAACQGGAAPLEAPAPVGLPDRDPGFLEVRAVEASGPPPQDPERPVTLPPEAVEDPESSEARLTEARLELGREQARRLEVERERDALQQRTRDLEARVLSLTLERTRLEQEVLQLRIDALRAELAATGR
jgi:hypothetical protein